MAPQPPPQSASAPSNASPVPPLGARFEIRRRLGGGGFGTVYEAHDRQRGTEVALKVLRRAGPDALYKFKQEFRQLADITHPNLLALYELFSQGEQWFFTMELVPGQDALSHVQRRPVSSDSPTWEPARALEATRVAAQAGPLPPAGADAPAPPPPAPTRSFADSVDEGRLRRALEQLATGLCFLHDAGKVHRDIKPSNMLITDEGRLVLLDFGLVRELHETSTQSQENIVGTPGYMSPEQAGSRFAGAPSDWYAVGVFLYEALAGRLPFEGSWLQVLAQKQLTDPPAPSLLSLGVPPDLEALCMDLLQRAPEDRPGGRQVLQRLGRRGAALDIEPAVASARALLRGREAHLRALLSALGRTQGGQAAVVVLRGQPGMGVSSLIKRFSEHLDAVVLSGRCYQQESVPYKALDGVLDALSRYLRRLPIHEAQALLPPDIRALARLFPVLLQVEAVIRAPRQEREPADRPEVRRRAFGALRELLGRIADRRSLVVAIDDLQWGDADSAALLLHALRAPGAPAMLLVLGHRSDEEEGSPCLRALLPALRRAKGAAAPVELELGPLSEEDALLLAEGLLGQQLGPGAPGDLRPYARAIAKESLGQPAVIEEMSRFQAAALRDGGEAGQRVTLDDVVQGRLRQLPAAAQLLLQAVAVAAGPIGLSTASAAAGTQHEDGRALHQLRTARLCRLRASPEREEIEIYNAHIGEAVLRHLSPEELRQQHLRLAEALAAAGGDAEVLCRHYRAAGERGRAVTHAVSAGHRAEAALAFDQAARLYQLAVELQEGPPDPALLEQLADALKNGGRGVDAARAYLKAGLARKEGGTQALELRRRAAEQLLHSGHIEEGLAVLGAMLKSVGLGLPERPLWVLVRLLLLRAWLWAHATLRGLGFRERAAAEVPEATLLRLDTCWSLASGLGNLDTMRGAYFGTLHLRLALRAGEPERVLRALALEVSYGALAGGQEPSGSERRAAEHLQALTERLGRPYGNGISQLFSGVAAVLRGRWQHGLDALDRATEILRGECTGVAWELDSAQHFALLCLGVLGRWKELRRRLPGIVEDARQRGDRYAEVTVQTRVAHIVELQDGRPQAARAAVAEALSAWPSFRDAHGAYHIQHYFTMISLSDTALYEDAGVGGGALGVVREHWPSLARSRLLHAQSIRGDAVTLRANAHLAAGWAAQGAERRSLLGTAERLCRALQRERMPWISAKARMVRAAIAHCRGDDALARRLLQQAEAGFAQSGMQLHAAVARRRLGQLLGGPEGRGMVLAADVWMLGQAIREPPRVAAMICPGRWAELPSA